MWCVRFQIQFRNHPEHQNHQFWREQKDQTLKHNSPMLPTSCMCARWKLTYGKYGWPLYYSYEKKIKENEKLVSNSVVSIRNSAKASTDKFASANASESLQPCDSTPPSAVLLLVIATKLSSSSPSPPHSWWLRAHSSPLTRSKNLLIHSSPSLAATFKSATTGGLGKMLTVEASFSIAGYRSLELETLPVHG